MTTQSHAATRIEKARVRLQLERRFYGVLVANVEPVESKRFPTMATNGKQHFFNPDFIDTLTEAELLGVQAHESEHDARHHGTRRNGRDPILWNEACDYAINIDLIDEGFVLPKGALIDAKYRGMAAEDVFRSRELDRQKQKQQEQEQDDEQDDADSDGDDQSTPDSDEAGDDAGSEGSDEGSEDAGEAAGEGEGAEGDEGSPDDGTATTEAGSQPGGGNGSEPEGSDDGTGNGADGTAGEAALGTACPGKSGRGTAGEAEGEGEPGQPGSPEPYQVCGEVLDTATDANDLAEADLDWSKVVEQAATMARARGQLPGHVSRDIEMAKNPPRDWRDELREFCEQGALRIETWNRPNKRFAHSGLILPGSQRHGISKAAFIIDTSGSMDAVALACVNQETQAMLDDGIIDEVVVIYGDTQVNKVDTYVSGDNIEFDPRGGGGTVIKPMFDYVAEQVSDASLIVAFTDLYIDDLGNEPPHCPVMFCVTGYPQTIKQRMDNAPWGAAAIDVGAH
jgi:predicted metal-dependent peptidase